MFCKRSGIFPSYSPQIFGSKDFFFTEKEGRVGKVKMYKNVVCMILKIYKITSKNVKKE